MRDQLQRGGGDGKTQQEAKREERALLAHCTADVWSLGVLLFQLCQPSPLTSLFPMHPNTFELDGQQLADVASGRCGLAEEGLHCVFRQGVHRSAGQMEEQELMDCRSVALNRSVSFLGDCNRSVAAIVVLSGSSFVGCWSLTRRNGRSRWYKFCPTSS